MESNPQPPSTDAIDVKLTHLKEMAMSEHEAIRVLIEERSLRQAEALAAHVLNNDLKYRSLAEATEKAAEDIDRRLDSMNEFREQLGTERAAYLLRTTYDREHGVLTDRVTQLESTGMKTEAYDREHTELQRRVTDLELTRSNSMGKTEAETTKENKSHWVVGLMVTLVVALIALTIQILKTH